jgi:hypothetical protein
MSIPSFSIHFDEEGEIISVTEPPVNVLELEELQTDKGGPGLEFTEGVEVTYPTPVRILKTREYVSGRVCRWVYRNGRWVYICSR